MVDLGGYIIILTNDDGKIRLYGSAADNADLEAADEILEVNGRTLGDATHNEVIQYIHECIKSRSICLRVRRRGGNKMEKLDGPSVGRIRDAWVIAVESRARERLQKLTTLKKIQPRDIEAILQQQINDAVASTSEQSAPKDVTNDQITFTLADKELGTNAFSTKLSNGTIPKGLGKEADIRVENISKDALEKQHSYPEEPNLLQPVQSGRIGERRASSPFQNGRTEVLIGETEGGPRSPRGSTSSAVNDGNFLNPPDERDYPEPICRSRRRSGSGVTDIHSQQQQQQLQENNNSSSRDAKKPQEGLGPDEMWAPGALGHHRELPVDVPDTLLQKAYPNKVKNRSSDYRNGLQHRPRSASDLDLDLSLNLKNETLKTRTIADGRARLVSNDCTDVTDNARTINIRNGLQPSMLKIELKIEDEEEKVRAGKKDLGLDKYHGSPTATGSPDLKSTFEDFEEEENTAEDAGGQKESSVDVEDDYPFAKEDYPTMLKTCSDDSASPRSSSGRSDSTAPLDTSLMLKSDKNRKDSPTYDVRRIDLGSPCRSVVPDIKVAPLFSRSRDATSFDNPAYGLTDLQDLHGLLRSDEVTDLTRLIDEQCSIPRIPKDQDKASPDHVKDQQTEPAQTEVASKPAKSSKHRPNDERAKLKAKTRSLDIEELIRAGSTDDLIGIELSNLSSSSRQRPKKKRHQQISSGYSTLRSEASGDLELTADRSFLVVGGKAYREVAVDCPPDFVPVTKCHPVYPPPNKTPGNSKHNTLEPRRDCENVVKEGNLASGGVAGEASACATTMTTTTTTTTSTTTLVASPCLSSNDNSLATLSSADGSARETVVAHTVDRKHDAKKVRFRVKSLLLDGLHSAMYHEQRYCHILHSLRASNTHLSNMLGPTCSEPVLHTFSHMELRDIDFESTGTQTRATTPSELNAPDEGGEHVYENPAFIVSLEDVRREGVLPRQRYRKKSGITDRVRSVFRGRFSRYRRESPIIFHSDGEKITFPACSIEFDDFMSRSASSCASEDKIVSSSESLFDSQKESEEAASPNCSAEITEGVRGSLSFQNDIPLEKVAGSVPPFVQETEQNCRNSLRELSPTKCLSDDTRGPNDSSPDSEGRERCDNNFQCRDDSPNTLNSKNSNLSDECSELLDASLTFSSNTGGSHNSFTGETALRCASSDSKLSDLIADCPVSTIRFSLSDSVLHLSKNSSSWYAVKWSKRDRSVVLYNSNERTKQGEPRPSAHTVENDVSELHEDALEQRVNCNKYYLGFR